MIWKKNYGHRKEKAKRKLSRLTPLFTQESGEGQLNLSGGAMSRWPMKEQGSTRLGTIRTRAGCWADTVTQVEACSSYPGRSKSCSKGVDVEEAASTLQARSLSSQSGGMACLARWTPDCLTYLDTDSSRLMMCINSRSTVSAAINMTRPVYCLLYSLSVFVGDSQMIATLGDAMCFKSMK